MRNAHTVTQIRDAEAVLLACLPPGALMQRAVYGLVAHVARRLGHVYGARIVVLAGGGDNGGDALWAGARLAARGARVDAVAPGRTHPEGSAALLAAGGRLHGPASELDDETLRGLVDRADLVLDGLLGIGGRGGLRADHARLAALAPPERTVAVDVPSGVDADTGAVTGPAVRASATVTFGTHKRGLWLMPGAAHTGPVELVDIGLALPEPDLRALDDADVAAMFPVPGPESSKYRRGVLGLVAGSDAYPGAAVLAVGGALRGGAGYLRVVTEGHALTETPDAHAHAHDDGDGDRDRADDAGGSAVGVASRAGEFVRLAHPEAVVTAVRAGDRAAMLAAGRVQAWAIGPGLDPGPAVRELVAGLLGTDLPVVVDAGALDPLAEILAADPAALRDRGAPVLLTPHEGEFGRLTAAALGWDPDRTTADLAADRLATVRRAAAATGAVILLKGTRTLIVEPAGAAWVNTTGSGWLGTAGTGDVLTGLIGSLLAAGLPAAGAGAVGAYLHGRAAERAAAPLAAGDLPNLLPRVIAELLA
ncbi:MULTISPECIES: bifunctional ADP-dependent NAD(P)H-hydrate dehydratase/NAD(P)H-hydrate epimerase [Frankia]|uniref:Bifunctional NAD(P)H-hydrate repair enzyme n=2 Tax=Frankia TaxID=1854 RepID=Q0RRN2_FRAAA|nr:MULTISPECIES: NAD(P)H-hydrate dehydratase [Frankia]CAJ59785.1 Putative ribokinase [Frankia alni ACN14a]